MTTPVPPTPSAGVGRPPSLTLLELQAVETLGNSKVLDLPQKELNAVVLYHLRALRTQGRKTVSWQQAGFALLTFASIFGPTLAELARQHPTALGGTAGVAGSLLTAWLVARRRAAGELEPPPGSPGPT